MDFAENLESLKKDIANTLLKFNEDVFSKHKEYIERAQVKFKKWEEVLKEREDKIEVKEKELEMREEVNLFTSFYFMKYSKKFAQKFILQFICKIKSPMLTRVSICKNNAKSGVPLPNIKRYAMGIIRVSIDPLLISFSW